MATQPYYDSSIQKIPALDEIREIVRYKYLISQLTRRDILARYKRSVLGVAWTMLNPLMMMIILSIVFSQLFAISVKSYPAYILSGLIVWNFFAQGTNAAMSGLIWGGSLIQRIYVPRTSFGISAIFTALVNFVLSIVPLVLVMLFTQISVHWSILFIPVSVFLLACYALGIGLIVSTLAVYFPDVAEMYQIILLAWMYLTPIIYPEEIVPANFQWIFKVNPMYYLVQIFRLPLLDKTVPTIEQILPAALFSILALVIGWIFFTSKSDEFAYRI
jgi:homopolymeric O-antigen transport system permease protein